VNVSYTEDSLTKTATYSVDVTTVGAIQGSGAGGYTLVTDAASLAVGDQVFIAASGSDYAMSTTQNTNNRGQVAITKDTATNTATFTGSVQIFTLQAGTTSGTYSFYDSTAKGYIYANSSSKNYLKTETTLDANGSWTISISNGVASVTANGSNTHNILQYNVTASIFSCYSSSQADVALYKASASQLFTDAEEATAWATYFTSCTSSNCHTASIWNTVNTQYTGMSDTAKAYFVAHESSDATIKAAYDRYTFALGQYPTLTDFIGGASGSAASLTASDTASYWALGAILSVFALTTIGYISFSFKKKHQ
jgi:hypothetical protein